MANTASKKALRHGGVTVALTVLVVVSIILLNAAVTTLATSKNQSISEKWYINMNPDLLYPVTDTCFDYLDSYVMPDVKDPIRIIFCDEKPNIEAEPTLAYVQGTATELAERYPNQIQIEYLNVWENPKKAREWGVTASTSVVVASGDAHRVCTLRDFFLFPADDSENPVAYTGEKRFAVAMKAVVSPNAPVAYFTLNHGEAMEDYALLYAVTDAGYMVSYLDALSFEIPEDCGLLISYNPARDFTAVDGVSGISEIDKLDAYLEKGGQFMCFVSADTFAAGGFPHLEGYLSRWGATFEHDTGAEGVEECFAIRDTAHALTTDGYTLVGNLPTAGDGGTIMADLDGTLRVSNATAISVAEGYAASNGNYVKGTRTLTPLLRSYAGAEAWAGGRPVDRTAEGYNLVTLTRDTATDASVLVCSSTEFATESTLQSGVYANGSFLLTAMEAMGKDEVPVGLKPQPFADDTIHILTTVQARNITIALVAVPVLVVLAVGMIVLIRRKFA